MCYGWDEEDGVEGGNALLLTGNLHYPDTESSSSQSISLPPLHLQHCYDTGEEEGAEQ